MLLKQKRIRYYVERSFQPSAGDDFEMRRTSYNEVAEVDQARRGKRNNVDFPSGVNL